MKRGKRKLNEQMGSVWSAVVLMVVGELRATSNKAKKCYLNQGKVEKS